MPSDEQRHELAQFIRSRRERRRPEDVGLPSVGHATGALRAFGARRWRPSPG
ncbi:hypothetical protein ACFV1D_16020 [Streptomyces mirabilis]|uniref:hypothetical protein n=1 Tax=Streptomyces mirabilis TaxID=68239 RepID=UPI0036A55FBB